MCERIEECEDDTKVGTVTSARLQDIYNTANNTSMARAVVDCHAVIAQHGLETAKLMPPVFYSGISLRIDEAEALRFMFVPLFGRAGPDKPDFSLSSSGLGR